PADAELAVLLDEDDVIEIETTHAHAVGQHRMGQGRFQMRADDRALRRAAGIQYIVENGGSHIGSRAGERAADRVENHKARLTHDEIRVVGLLVAQGPLRQGLDRRPTSRNFLDHVHAISRLGALALSRVRPRISFARKLIESGRPLTRPPRLQITFRPTWRARQYRWACPGSLP